MLSAESFWASSLRQLPDGERVTRILSTAINSIDPGLAVIRYVQREGDLLTVAGRVYDLSFFHRVVLLGMGKASVSMSEALANILADRLSAGLIVSKQAPLDSHSPVDIMVGGHPIPDERSLEAGKKAIELVSSLSPNDLLFCLISGGASALVAAPVSGISLADIQSLTSALLACGARIDEINTLRRRLDLLKGGGMVKLSSGATIVSLILSDVVGNSLEAIASGPTAPDPASRVDSLSVLAKYGLENSIPTSILFSLKTSPETLKPGDTLFANVQNVIVGGNLQAAQAALTQAQLEGFHPYLLTVELQGEASQVAFELATVVRQASLTGDPVPAPSCIVAGGETTVTLKGNGKGGRNTELALAAVTELADFPGVMLITLATDGEDGPTDAAGAVVTGDTFRRAAALGLQPGVFLERNDSFTFFSALGDLIKTGPTGTNGNDLVFMFTY
jgi:hydroxypyruvate reductase